MEAFTVLEAPAAPLLRDDIDTDALFPAAWVMDFDTDYGAALFANWRYLDARSVENPEFVLNREGFRAARILVAGANFGCGSSRSHAVWALAAFGIRAVIAPSFADIFRGNAIREGILPLVLPRPEVERLAAIAAAHPGATFRIDLQSCRVRDPLGGELAFEIDAPAREHLLSGLDEIDSTLRHRAAIERYEAGVRAKRRQWAAAGIPHDDRSRAR
ncbi:MAG: 3-isopropylmalate dehydratase small subunit [Betaproteobacteria bacterium CG2_30_68_42]|nr:MAG: 3-isopropylmalate dehydratase small subunit [Betaproteobacteria bacterium CG2_30_68_42]PIX75594.1 MAG: 3-isopropylmalate dehydratase small subunit [Rhodocyclales bacterium CG_4_10_14_3_um_filter_68_10]